MDMDADNDCDEIGLDMTDMKESSLSKSYNRISLFTYKEPSTFPGNNLSKSFVFTTYYRG